MLMPKQIRNKSNLKPSRIEKYNKEWQIYWEEARLQKIMNWYSRHWIVNKWWSCKRFNWIMG